MTFYDVVQKFKDFDYQDFFEKVTDRQIEKIIDKEKLDKWDFLALLSPTAEKHMEEMAQKSHRLSLKYFGKNVVMYTPMYVANYCSNKCAYCGYNCTNKINRKVLTLDEVDTESKAVHDMGFRHVIILTGESRKYSPVSYIRDCVKIMNKYFSSICLEIYSLKEEEYEELVKAGADSLTMYQETYNQEVYSKVHLGGPKKNYRYRLETPERACEAGIYSVGLGPLYGLYDWRQEAFFGGLHGAYIQKKFPGVDVNFSVPRIRPHAGSFNDLHEINDKNMVQILLALKLFIPRSGTNITTRESRETRDNLIPLGVTKMSAGVTTEVGGHTLKNPGEMQFDNSDKRSLEEVKQAIIKKGYFPVMKDWEPLAL
ncbi:MAG TPA: 2-iminoacetate synthase ThiH [Clostridium sp.]|uniref:2-iminoacetate synthase ThiH n=1 Tax=Clostridium lapidicellarium TaxID=3240931 RepID=A0ABV4E0Y2_9CLOT|nr:2-iminoacetate synthase ThiH [uncultured Clostridium sp.]NLU08241.1 2-iminoacetate synthase ThiH [Clostridiales bacterium]HBC97242.1 2-iminoacetate synthase ThiH [Clostridium sp.]